MIRTIQIDWDDPSALKKLYLSARNRRTKILAEKGYIEGKFGASVHNITSVLPIFESMLQCNLEHLYKDDDTSDNYVYAHCNPLTVINPRISAKHAFLAIQYPQMRFEPFYVGKGRLNRCNLLDRSEAHRKIRSKIKKAGEEVVVCKLVTNLTTPQALNVESNLIAILGLRCLSPHGLLANLAENPCAEERYRYYTQINPNVTKILKANGIRH